MKYLQKSFTFAVSSPPAVDPAFRSLARGLDRISQQKKAKKKHEYMNNGAMCLVCGLAKEAPIHPQEK
jgi:hypothetical protein